jgi:hypothetical protein
MVRWRRRASSARYGVGATALTLRRLELAWSSGGIGLVAARASRARGSEKEVVNELVASRCVASGRWLEPTR